MTRRTALVVGINYTASHKQATLQGCINDAQHMSQHLRDIGYTVTTLCDDDPVNMPTATRILRELLALVQSARGSDASQLVFHFSGHGIYVSDADGDERDGRDECLVAVDDQIIRDDTLNTLLGQLPASAHLLCTVDACHSGSMIDLPYMASSAVTTCKYAYDAQITLLSACMDAQLANDTTDIRPEYNSHAGALTSALLFCLRYTTEWGQLLKLIRFVMRRRRYAQIPQLSATCDCTQTHAALLTPRSDSSRG